MFIVTSKMINMIGAFMDFIDKLKTDYNIILNEQQKQAVLKISGAMLILAVPGSGKTTVIIAHIGNMIYNHAINPKEILTLTFSVAAANDMKNRFISLFGTEYSERMEFKTIHSFCFGVIKYYERLYNKTAFKLIENQIMLLKKIYIELFKEYPGDDMLSTIAQAISYSNNMMHTKADIEKICIPECNFWEIYAAYDEHKLKNKLMDFDDMLSYSFTILNKYNDILKTYQNRYKYLNVDEAQDTSYLQHEIIRLLAKRNNNIFMVGDEDQSIYGFRAAFPKALLDFKSNYTNANVMLLEQNYRSTKKIINVSNNFIKQNTSRYDKIMFTQNADGADIKITKLSDLAKQYKYITELIKFESASKSIAILYRNNDSAVPLVDVLERTGITFKIKENTPLFFTHFVTNDIICFLRLAQNFNSIDAFGKIYFKLGSRITKAMYEYVKNESVNTDKDVFELLLSIPDLDDKKRKKIKDMKHNFVKLRHMSKQPLKSIKYIENKMGYYDSLCGLSSKGYALEPLMQKLNALKIIASKQMSSDDFFSRLSYIEKIMQNPSQAHFAQDSKLNALSTSKSLPKISLTLSTIHSSKGLEFDKVIIIDAIEGQFPTQESITKLEAEDKRELIEEETRLFYVAITRARNELQIITANALNNTPITASRFINQLIKKN